MLGFDPEDRESGWAQLRRVAGILLTTVFTASLLVTGVVMGLRALGHDKVASYASDTTALNIKGKAPAKPAPITTEAGPQGDSGAHMPASAPSSGPRDACPSSKNGGNCFNYQPKNGTCIWKDAKYPANVKLAWKINQSPLGFGSKYWNSWCKLGMAESGWKHTSLGPYVKRKGDNGKPLGRACGIAQALPCIKVDRKHPVLDTHGKRLDSFKPEDQIMWMLHYIRLRYGNPDNAWKHEYQHQWY
jgi:hypothetical protein